MIRQPVEGEGYRVHLPNAVHTLPTPEEAVVVAQQATAELAEAQARQAGAGRVTIETQRNDHIARVKRDDDSARKCSWKAKLYSWRSAGRWWATQARLAMAHDPEHDMQVRTHRFRLAALALSLLFVLPGLSAQVTPASAQPRKPRVMVALVFGQSNAANFGETRYVAGRNVYVLHRGRLYLARDPLRGANGEGGSVWTRLGDKLIAEGLFDRVIFVPAAVGGTEIARWTPDGDLFPLVARAIEDVQRRKLKFTHLLWHQGESDAVLFTHPREYQKRFLEMLAGIRARGVDAPVFVAVATRCGQYPVNPDIQWAQRDLVNPAAGILPGPDTDLLDSAFRHDGCHFSDAGLDAHAEMWLRQIKAYLPPDRLTAAPWR